MAETDTMLSASQFEARVERVGGTELADRVRSINRWLEAHGAGLDAFMKTTMISLFAWWHYDVPGKRLQVLWPLALRIEGRGGDRVMLRVVFQELRFRPPFDDIAVRRQFLERLERAGFDRNANLGGRPGIDVAALDDANLAALFDALEWFLEVAGLT